MTHAGAARSKNVGTSNHNGAENAPRRKTKVSLAMSISQGLVGPKGMAKAAPDGQQVNIPALRFNRSRVLTDNLMSLWFLPLCVRTSNIEW